MRKSKQTDRKTNIPIELECAIRRIAQEQGLRVALDTHYDAQNCELSWINGRVKYRIDFQSISARSTNVTLYYDHYRCLPKLLSWADLNIPCFAYLSPVYMKIDYQSLIDLSNDESFDYYIKVIRELINGVKKGQRDRA